MKVTTPLSIIFSFGLILFNFTLSLQIWYVWDLLQCFNSSHVFDQTSINLIMLRKKKERNSVFVYHMCTLGICASLDWHKRSIICGWLWSSHKEHLNLSFYFLIAFELDYSNALYGSHAPIPLKGEKYRGSLKDEIDWIFISIRAKVPNFTHTSKVANLIDKLRVLRFSQVSFHFSISNLTIYWLNFAYYLSSVLV